MSSIFTLADLGWSAAFDVQLPPGGNTTPARIAAVHRDRAEALMPAGPVTLTLPPGLSTHDVAVGDWVLADPATARIARLLDRQSLIARRAAGTGADRQLIAANLDALAIVTSCNAEFSQARLERYLSLARGSAIAPVVVLTKADTTDPAPWLAKARASARGAPVITLDARDAGSAAELAAWAAAGRTLGLVGSSGVGKSTLAATLTGTARPTAAIREDDAKGRHTTTARFLLRTMAGGWLLDTPGMRELRLTDTAQGIAQTFDDIETLARACRFTDCAHDSEPGCAVQAAIAAGEIAEDRLRRWRKLLREDRRNAETLARAQQRQRSFGKRARRALQAKEHRRRGA